MADLTNVTYGDKAFSIATGGGSKNYEDLSGLPTIEGHVVKGDKGAVDYNLASITYVDTTVGNIETLLNTL